MSDGTFLEPILGSGLPWLYVDSAIWTGVGLLGNGMFSTRFLYQWLHSERKKKLLVPPAFWYLSFWGSSISLLYAIHLDKLPVILGFCFLPFLYARNIALLKRDQRQEAASVAEVNAGHVSPKPKVVSLSEKFAAIQETWQPRVAARVQDMEVKLAKLHGEFVWHQHEKEDELFLVHKGQLRIELRDGCLDLGPGDLAVIPRGVEHLPVAEEEAEVLLIEVAGTRNTGETGGDRTVEQPQEI